MLREDCGNSVSAMSSAKAGRSSKWLSPGSCTPVRTASTTRSWVSRLTRPLATLSPARNLPSRFAAASSARTTVVPIATTRPPSAFVGTEDVCAEHCCLQGGRSVSAPPLEELERLSDAKSGD